MRDKIWQVKMQNVISQAKHIITTDVLDMNILKPEYDIPPESRHGELYCPPNRGFSPLDIVIPHLIALYNQEYNVDTNEFDIAISKIHNVAIKTEKEEGCCFDYELSYNVDQWWMSYTSGVKLEDMLYRLRFNKESIVRRPPVDATTYRITNIVLLEWLLKDKNGIILDTKISNYGLRGYSSRFLSEWKEEAESYTEYLMGVYPNFRKMIIKSAPKFNPGVLK